MDNNFDTQLKTGIILIAIVAAFLFVIGFVFGALVGWLFG